MYPPTIPQSMTMNHSPSTFTSFPFFIFIFKSIGVKPMQRKGIRKVFSERFLRKMLTTRARCGKGMGAPTQVSDTYVGVGGPLHKSLTLT